MEPQNPSRSLSQLAHTLVANIASPQQFHALQQSLLQMRAESQQVIENKVEESKHEEAAPLATNTVHKDEAAAKEEEKQHAGKVELQQVPKLPLQVSPAQEMQLYQDAPTTFRKQEPKPQREPLSEPPLIANRRHPTEQSSQKSRTNQKESRQQSRRGRNSEEQSLNLDLTQKTKRSKNMSFTNKADSLLYSDATLMYSNDTGFDREASHSHLPQRTASHKAVLKQVPDEEAEAEISARMERAESRQCERVATESQKASQMGGVRLESQPEEGNVFQTQINQYKGKISKIRQLKENKKRKLEAQLRRINQQLQDLTKREQAAAQAIPLPNNFQSRVKISDNVQAKVKAERFVRDLHHNKRSRQDAQLGELQVIDKNINSYMEQLMKERYKNEQRIKQRKKLEIIDRMKQQEVRKIEEQRQRDKNLQFLHQLRGSNSKAELHQRKPSEQTPPQPENKSKQRSPTKKSEPIADERETPELSRKKAYLKKIRNLSFRKEKADAYEQLLN